jgi:type I restriction enzyme S subunit
MYGATIGKTSILGFNATTNQACAIGKPIEGITDTTFLYYLLRNEKDAFIAKGKGGAQPNISQALIKEHEIALPPLAEQKVIAEKLDTLLAQVETTKARLERIPKILKRFRQSVLAAAVSGRLSDGGRAYDESRPRIKLAELCATAFDGPFGSKLKSSDYTNSGIGVVRLENIKHLTFDESKKTFISEEKYLTLSKNKLEKDDILFSSFVDEEVRACLFPFNTLRFINKADCFCLRIDQSKSLPEFVLYLLTSQFSYAQIKEHVQGITRPRVNLGILKSLEFPVPPIQEQTEIVRRVDQLFAHADRIEQEVNDALSRVNNLTQSILAKAFRGELTEQWRKDNPNLISGENSAEALLERIKAERANQTPTKPPKGRKRSAKA